MTDTPSLTPRQESGLVYAMTLMWVIRGSIAYDTFSVIRGAWTGDVIGVLITLVCVLVELSLLVVVAARLRPLKQQVRNLKIEALERDLGMR